MINHIPNVLVVDDNFYNRDVCALALNHVGYHYVEAEDGQKAIDLLQTESFNLILLDLAMPELDGRSVIHRLTEMGIRDKLIIVVITAHSHLATDIENLADYVIYKPIDIQMLTTILERLFVK